MKINLKIDLHSTALFFCFTTGGCLFLFGKCGIINVFFAFLSGILTLIVFHFVLIPLCLKTKPARVILAVLCAGTFLYTFIKYTDFTKATLLLYTPRAAIALIFVAAAAGITVSRDRTIKKFCLLTGIVSIVFSLIIFGAAALNFEVTNISCLPSFELKEVFRTYIIMFFPVFIPAIYKKPDLLSAGFGVTVSFILLFIFSLFTVCTFGTAK